MSAPATRRLILLRLARHRLIDEYRLTVHPVALGDGLRLLHGPQRLNLVSSTAWADGCVTQVYTP